MKYTTFEERYKSCQVEPLSIDKLGWEAFLQQWNKEVVDQVKKTTLRFGAEPKARHTSKTWKKQLADYQIPYEPFKDLIQGGIDYPPKTEQDEKKVNDTLALHRQFIELVMTRRLSKPFNPDELSFQYSHDEILYRDSILYPPADPEAIVAKEKELGVSFPDTYKAMLAVSNGIITDLIKIVQVNKLSWLFSREQASYIFWEIFIEYPDERHFIPGEILPPELIEEYGEAAAVYEFERQSLLFSNDYLTFYLIFNPNKKNAKGDWLGWRDSEDGDGGMEININKPLSFTAQMEYFYQEDMARKCASYKKMEDFHPDK